MSNERKLRLIQVAKEFKVGMSTITDFLQKKGIKSDGSPNSLVETSTYDILEREFGSNRSSKDERASVRARISQKQASVSIETGEETPAAPESPTAEAEVAIKSNVIESTSTAQFPKVLGRIDLSQSSGKRGLPQNKKKSNNHNTQSANVASKPTPSEAPKVVEAPKEQSVATPKVEPQKSIEIERKVETKVEPKMEVKVESKPTPVTAAEQTKVEPVVAKSGDAESKPKDGVFRPTNHTLSGPQVLGTMDVSAFTPGGKHKRKRLGKEKVDVTRQQGGGNKSGGQGGNRQGGQGNGANGGNNNNNNNNGGQRTGGGNNNNAGQGQGRRNGGGNNNGGNNNNNNRNNNNRGGNNNRPSSKPVVRAEVSDEEVSKQVKDTLARLTAKGAKGKGAKYRKDKRDAFVERSNEERANEEMERSTLKVTEFVTASELATMMNVTITEVITACMNLGLMVSINQRLDAEALVVVAEEFGFKVEFVSVEIQEAISDDDEDTEENLISRPPIVTVMGHVDHGKTSLLDNIRKANVIEGEAGGITQHIGAYSAELDGQRITFLDTPGHEAFTAMRARGAKVTDVAIIIVAADDSVMPQTVEAINHAQAAGVPMVFAINKCDKPAANPEHIKEQLAQMNYLVEDWGGKYQSQDVSAKQGLNLDKLLSKVLLEAEMLDLKANPNRKAQGAVIESTLDKGRGYVSTILVQNGTLRVGDVILSGVYTGRVKAMFNENGRKLEEAGPSTPVQVLGLNGAPQAGDSFNVMDDDRSAREIANKREQLQRMQGLMTQKHVTLDEIGRRIAIGSFKELNIIIKGDVDGSIEAMSGSLIKLSKEEVQVNVIHAAVGQISESDVLLAAASNAIIVGFQVRPSSAARKVAEKEEIEIRLYSIIYDAINDIKDAIEGMLEPIMKEEIVCSVEVLEVFKISKVGSVAGCMVREGKITRNTPIRIIRDGIVIHTGKLGSLKRFKDDVKEVASGFDCGLNIDSYNDIKIGDIVEGYEQVEVKRTSK
ncbi:MAG: translation initiation factor IF-2 [Rikenellaceae bacterium]